MPRFIFLLLGLLCGWGVSTSAHAASEPTRVFIFAGQSNMVGSDSKVRDIERNRETLKKQVVKQCKKHKGRAADGKLINACLEASGGKTDPESCKKFADCFGKFLKEKSK